MPFRADIFETPDAPGKVFYIDNRILSYHDIEMNLEEVRGFRYGTMAQYWENYNLREGFSTFDFVDTSNDEINVHMINTPAVTNENMATMSNMVFGVQKYLGNKLMLDMVTAIHAGTEIQVGSATVDRYGIHFNSPNTSGYMVRWDLPWEQVHMWFGNGQLNITSFVNKDANLWLDARTEFHVHTLHAVLYAVQQDPLMLGRIRATQPAPVYYKPMD